MMVNQNLKLEIKRRQLLIAETRRKNYLKKRQIKRRRTRLIKLK